MITRDPIVNVTTGAGWVGATLKRGFHHSFGGYGGIEHGLEVFDQTLLARDGVAAAHPRNLAQTQRADLEVAIVWLSDHGRILGR